jgi:hypothetical protein
MGASDDLDGVIGISLLLALVSPVLGFFAYWVFQLLKLGWNWGDSLKQLFLGAF